MQIYVLILTILLTSSYAEELRLVDLEPNVAEQYINQQDQSLRYAPKVESNVPGLRFIGKERQQVIEDIYLANQYHGQDGLGAYVYGYAVPDIAKTEKKSRTGDLKGAYSYINQDGQEIKVEYWDDGNGFHQIDNVPQILPKQVEDTPEVKAAKEEHFRIWQEEALRNSQPPKDPNANYNPQVYQQPPQVQQLGPSTPNPGLAYHQPPGVYSGGPTTYPNYPAGAIQYSGGPSPYPGASTPYPGGPHPAPSHIQSQYLQYQGPVQVQQPSNSISDYSGQYSETQKTYVKNPNEEDDGSYKEELQGPPKGFFYSFDYPVGIIVQKQGDLGGAYAQNKELFEKQLRGDAPAPYGGANSYHTQG